VAAQLGGGIIVYKSVPWAKRGKALLSIKMASFPKGAVPPHLIPYVDRFISAVGQCRPKIVKGRGAATVQGFNACLSAQLGGKGRA